MKTPISEMFSPSLSMIGIIMILIISIIAISVYIKNSNELLLNEINENERNVIGNLTDHRVIANISYAELFANQKKMTELLENITK